MKNISKAPRSWVYDVLYGFKENARTWFIAWLITFIALLMSVVYIVYITKDTQIVDASNTQDIQDFDAIYNSTITNGG